MSMANIKKDLAKTGEGLQKRMNDVYFEITPPKGEENKKSVNRNKGASL